MNEELISVIIPVYNVEKYLKKCLDSVIGQTYKNLEIILIDDGSTDESYKILEEYKKKDNRIRVIHKENEGLSSARNVGLDNASGVYIQFVDSDDYLELDMIECMYKITKKYDSDIVTFSHYITVGDKDIYECSKELKLINKMNALEELMLDGKIRSYMWEKLWKRSLFENIRFPLGKRFEDIFVAPLLFDKADRVVIYDIPKYHYVQREGSILSKQSNDLRLDYIEAVCEANRSLRQKYPEMGNVLNYSMVNMVLKTYNDIAIFCMYDLLQEKIIKKIYDITKKIWECEENREFIKEKSNSIQYKHIELLMQDKDEYIEKHMELPVIYPEHIGVEEKNKHNLS